MTRFMEFILATLALLFITGTSTSPIRCDHGVGRYGGGSGYSSHALRYCRDEFDDDDDYYGNRGGGRYYDYDGEREDWDSNEDEDFLDGGNYGNEDSDNGEDDFFGFHHHNHEA